MLSNFPRKKEVESQGHNPLMVTQKIWSKHLPFCVSKANYTLIITPLSSFSATIIAQP